MIHFLRTLAAKLRGLFVDRRAEQELDDEIEMHLRLLTERYIRQGMSVEEAARTARRQFGNITLLQELNREMRGIRFIETLFQYLKYGLGMLRRNPGFTFVAVLTLALGIGANTAIFSVVNGVLLNALPYPQPERLAMVWCDNRRQGIPDDITSYPNFVDWRDRNKTFQGMAGAAPESLNLTGVGEPEEIRAANVSTNFFQLIGVSPARGRGFTAEEEQPGNDKIVILSHALWQRRFGGDPGILNKTISLSGQPNVVVGIMPPGFQFPENTEMWRPLAPDKQLRVARSAFWLPVVGRLKPGVTRAQAQADLDVI